MATKKKMLQAAAGNAGGAGLDITEVFSTYLRSGTGAGTSFSVSNGIDLNGEGGLVWYKRRTGAATDHTLMDSERGAGYVIESNTTDYSRNRGWFTSFNSDGFSGNGQGNTNDSGEDYASWTFRKAPKFFTCVQYTGTGPGSAANEQQVSHDLGAKPGIVIIKRTDATGDWWVFTDVIDGSNDYGYLNQAAAFGATGNNVATDSVFSVGGVLNTSGATYTAYLFANNNGDGTFGPDGDQDVIKCGSFTTASSYGNINSIDLGWEAQFVLVKSTSAIGSWYLLDTMRGMPKSGNLATLNPNNSDSETAFGNNPGYLSPTATGFEGPFADLIGTSIDCVYIAIRRGPLAPPESATEVFAIDGLAGKTSPDPWFTSNFVTDLALLKQPSDTNNWIIGSRLQGTKRMSTDLTNAESDQSNQQWDYMDGVYDANTSDTYLAWMWKRAPGYFDVVAYTGNATAGREIAHNLGVAPELMIAKTRDAANYWVTYDAISGPTKFMILNQNNGTQTSIDHWNNTAPTSSVFTVGDGNYTNRNATQQIIYLFASLDGISKVGSFSHTQSSNTTVDCSFSNGVKFVLIKPTSVTGNWLLFDTERGITSSVAPALFPNLIAAEYDQNQIDPTSSGFIMKSGYWTTGNYIFYAIATS
jgi:hypothetical protein